MLVSYGQRGVGGEEEKREAELVEWPSKSSEKKKTYRNVCGTSLDNVRNQPTLAGALPCGSSTLRDLAAQKITQNWIIVLTRYTCTSRILPYVTHALLNYR